MMDTQMDDREGFWDQFREDPIALIPLVVLCGLLLGVLLFVLVGD